MSHSRGTQSASDASDDDDDGAPESFTLAQSKADVRRLSDARQAAESNTKRKRKEKNKLKDENLKRRARETRGISATQLNSAEKARIPRGKGEDPESHSEDEGRRTLEDRMERAMRDAQDEGDDDDEAWGGFGNGSEVEAGLSSELERASDGSDSTSEDEENMLEFNEYDSDSMEGVEEDELSEGPSSVRRPKEPKLDYLPEHLFSEALSKARRPRKQVASSPLKLETERSRKPSKKCKTKDIVLGSKIVRTVAHKTAHISSAASRTLPPGKVRRFYEDRLSLNPKRSGTKRGGWDRQVANIGVMRSSSLPASGFVRNS